MWSELRFGKHKGLTLPQVAFRDPDWLFWADETAIFRDHLLREAARVARRARRIRLPQVGPEKLEVEYLIDPVTNKCDGLGVVPASRGKHEGATRTCRSDHFNLGFARDLREYDKSGSAALARDVWTYLFGKTRRTRESCGAFFDDDKNFVLGEQPKAPTPAQPKTAP